jgi:acetylornithine deacetylase/succinyl-diaminopimelate desuccinylase-like protein
VERVIHVLEKVLGKAEFYLGWAGSTDARFFREIDIPAVVLGPAGGNYHGANEYVELDTVDKLARVLAQLVTERS